MMTLPPGLESFSYGTHTVGENRGPGDWYTIYHHLPVVKGVNKPLYSYLSINQPIVKGHLCVHSCFPMSHFIGRRAFREQTRGVTQTSPYIVAPRKKR